VCPGNCHRSAKAKLLGYLDPPAVKSSYGPLGGASLGAGGSGRRGGFLHVLGWGSRPHLRRGMAQPKQGEGAGWTDSRSYAQPRRKGVSRDLVDCEAYGLVYVSDWRPMGSYGGES